MKGDYLEIAGRQFGSPLFMGTSRFPNPQILREALEESGSELVTVAIRRINLEEESGAQFLEILREGNYHFLPQYRRLLHSARSDSRCRVGT